MLTTVLQCLLCVVCLTLINASLQLLRQPWPPSLCINTVVLRPRSGLRPMSDNKLMGSDDIHSRRVELFNFTALLHL